MTQTLYFTKLNDPNYQQVIIAAEFINVNVVTELINKKYDPLILVTGGGMLNQPNTILMYLVREKLVGQNEEQKMKVYQWFEFFNLELHPVLNEIVGQVNKEKVVNKQRYEYSVKELMSVLEIFNNHLKIRTVFVGNAITAVDISLATHLQTVFKSVISEQSRKKLNNLTRWLAFIRSTGPFLNVLGPVALCQKGKEFKVPETVQQAKQPKQTQQKKDTKPVQQKKEIQPSVQAVEAS